MKKEILLVDARTKLAIQADVRDCADQGIAITPESLAICVEWIYKNTTKRKTINKNMNSYGHKHRVEHFSRSKGSNGVYIPQMAFVLAAEFLGYKIRPTANGSNYFMNMSLNKNCRQQYV